MYYLIIRSFLPCITQRSHTTNNKSGNLRCWLTKNIDSISFFFNLDRGPRHCEEPKMSKFSAEGKYSEDSQGSKGKCSQLVGLITGGPYSPVWPMEMGPPSALSQSL